jgi:hypothetical protein
VARLDGGVPRSYGCVIPEWRFVCTGDQGRFAHLFRPARNESLIAQIQARVDAYWDGGSASSE